LEAENCLQGNENRIKFFFVELGLAVCLSKKEEEKEEGRKRRRGRRHVSISSLPPSSRQPVISLYLG
jgi:hypothetical protein